MNTHSYLLRCMLFLFMGGAGIFLLSGCGDGEYKALGDGTFQGFLPVQWHDAQRIEAGSVLRVIDDTVPLPREIVIFPAPEGESVSPDGEWVLLVEDTRPGPKVRTGDYWIDTTRAVGHYRKDFGDGRLFDAFVDRRFDRNTAEIFLDGISLANR